MEYSNDKINIENLYFKYKKRDTKDFLNNVNLKINKGDFHAFIGHNGAGKSTLIKLISGMMNLYNGNIFIDNINVKKDIGTRTGICYIPDIAKFPNNLSIYKYLYNIAILTNENKSQVKIDLDALINRFGLDHKRNPNKLSAGQKKKVLLIRAIIEKSNLIILDEPAANLDPTTRKELFTELKKLNEQGVTIIISSHILDEIKKYVNSATFIKSGEIKWSGKVSGEDIIKRYEDNF